jgi:pimeloyl-ACP methyl ester carboxylesterase
MNKKHKKLSNGETIYYLDEGNEKEVFVLIHGNMSSGVHYKPLIERLKNKYRIIAPDLRGFGDSSYINPIKGLEDFSDDVIELLDVLNVKKYNLAGWSTGGAISMKIAAKRQEQVQNLILIESCSYRGYPIYKKNTDGSPKLGEFYSSIEELAEDFIQVKPMDNIFKTNSVEIMNSIWNQAIYTVNKPSEEDNKLYLSETMKQRNIIDVDWALTTFNMSNFSNGVSLGDGSIKDVICPVLSFWSESDAVVLEYMVDETIEAIANSKKIILKNSGHSPLVDLPDTLANYIMEFTN